MENAFEALLLGCLQDVLLTECGFDQVWFYLILLSEST
jgi:hypothetical protein